MQTTPGGDVVLDTNDWTQSFDPIVQEALAGADAIDDLVGPFAGFPGGSGTEDLLGFINEGNTDVTGLINGFLDGDLSGPGDPSIGPSPLAPSLPGLPELQLPSPVTFVDPIIHPDEFSLNGFPHQGQDPTQPGYYSLPSY
jgi:hypothetical protein